jgi:hypothetical protein
MLRELMCFTAVDGIAFLYTCVYSIYTAIA